MLVESLRGQVEDSKQREVELNAKIAEGLVELAEIKEKLAAMPETVVSLHDYCAKVDNLLPKSSKASVDGGKKN